MTLGSNTPRCAWCASTMLNQSIFVLQNKFHTYSLMFSQFHWFYAKTVSVYRDKIFIYFERILVEYERNNYSLSLQGRTYTNWSTFWFHFVFSSIFFFVSFLVCVYTNLLIFFGLCVCMMKEKNTSKKALIVLFVAALNYNFAGKNNRQTILQKKNLISSSILLSINSLGKITKGSVKWNE